MRLWRWLTVILGAPMFVLFVIDLLAGSHHSSGDLWVGLTVPPALILWGFVLPRLGRLFGSRDEKALLDFVQKTLAARTEERAIT